MSKRRLPVFTIAELRAIHRSLFGEAWINETDDRRAVVTKLEQFFGDDTAHLCSPTPKKDKP